MSKIIFQNENTVLNHLGVRKVVKLECTAKVTGALYGTPAEIEAEVKELKRLGATNIKLK